MGDIDRKTLAERRATIIRRVQAIRAKVWQQRARRRHATSGAGALSEAAVRVREQEKAHPVLHAVSEPVAYRFRKLSERLPGLDVVRAKRRAHPRREMTVRLDRSAFPPPLRAANPIVVDVKPVAPHIVGTLREVWEEDIRRRPFRKDDGSVDLGGYLPGDRIGDTGVEAGAERLLRGRRGERVERPDGVRRRPPEPGKDIHLTLDIRLQARVQALLDPEVGLTRVQPWHDNERTPTGTPLHGSAVVMSVDSGGLLALGSTPTPASLPDDAAGERAYRASINAAVAAAYPPGSTVKPLTYVLAAGRGAIAPEARIRCEGHFFPDRPEAFRCWGWRPSEGNYLEHGPLGPTEAIARSCNIYFYTCGRSLGGARLVRGFRRFGLGREPRLALPRVATGSLPQDPDGIGPNTAMLLGIGQGPVAASPLQIAAAHVALARGGRYLSPQLVREREEKPTRHDVEVDPAVVRRASRGMRQSANARFGTASRIVVDGEQWPLLTLDGVVCRAKTGTAEVPPDFKDRNGNGRREDGEPIRRAGGHSWFVCHARKKGTEKGYVVVVVIEHGGSGGRVAGPVANQILHAMRREGYL